MQRRDDRYNDEYSRRENNFDRMFDAREYRDNSEGRYQEYDNRDNYSRDRDIRRRDDYRRDDRRYERPRYEDEYEEPKKRSFFSRGSRRRERDRDDMSTQGAGANDFVVMTPKSFEDIQGIIDNLKAHRGLIVDLCKLNGASIQRVMDYINGAIYALDGSIQRINPAVFLLTPTGMGISVPIDYIKDKWERTKRR